VPTDLAFVFAQCAGAVKIFDRGVCLFCDLNSNHREGRSQTRVGYSEDVHFPAAENGFSLLPRLRPLPRPI